MAPTIPPGPFGRRRRIRHYSNQPPSLAAGFAWPAPVRAADETRPWFVWAHPDHATQRRQTAQSGQSGEGLQHLPDLFDLRVDRGALLDQGLPGALQLRRNLPEAVRDYRCD
jgi:hypothetical protein